MQIDASSLGTTLVIGTDARFGDYVHIVDESVRIGDYSYSIKSFHL